MFKKLLNKVQRGFSPVELVIVVGIGALAAAAFIFTVTSPSRMAELPPINVNMQMPDGMVVQTPSRTPRALAADIFGKAVSVDGSFDGVALFRTTDGGLMSAGPNWAGQRGDGFTTDWTGSPFPSTVMVCESANGTFYSPNSWWCVGSDLQECVNWTSAEPCVVKPLMGVLTASASSDSVMALMDNGTQNNSSDDFAVGFGMNWAGELGIGDVVGPPDWDGTESLPVKVLCGDMEGTKFCSAPEGLSQKGVLQSIKQVVTSASEQGSYASTYAVLTDGTLLSWGRNSYGQLGYGDKASSSLPKHVKICKNGENIISVIDGQTCEGLGGTLTNLTGIKSVVGGYGSAYALTEKGRVLSWGWNMVGMLGQGDTVEMGKNLLTPSEVICGEMEGTEYCSSDGHLQGVKTLPVASAPVNMFFTLNNDTVVGVGGNLFAGIIGNGEVNMYGFTAPVQIKVCISDTTGEVISVPVSSPQQDCEGLGGTLQPFDNVVKIIPYITGFSIALKSDGTVWTWGASIGNQLGIHSPYSMITPVQVTDLSEIADIGAGYNCGYVVDVNGHTFVWGDNYMNQLGFPVPSRTIAAVNTKDVGGADDSKLSGVSKIDENYTFGAALKGDTVVAWGGNAAGQLGNGTFISSNTPVQVVTDTGVPISDVMDVSIGGNSVLALKNDGNFYAWGSNLTGQLGNGTTDPENTAILVDTSNILPEGETFTGIYARGSSFLITSEGNLYAWGSNIYHETGIPNADPEVPYITSPTKVVGISGVEKVTASSERTSAIMSDGTVYLWGRDNEENILDGFIKVTFNGNPLENIIDIDGDFYGNFIGLDNGGNLYRWSGSPEAILIKSGLTGAKYIEYGASFYVMIKNDGTLWAWGNAGGFLGAGDTKSYSEPVKVKVCVDGTGKILSINEYQTCPGHLEDLNAYAGNATDIAIGYQNTVAVVDAKVFAWGSRGGGALGDGTEIGTPKYPVLMDLHPDATTVLELIDLVKSYNFDKGLDSALSAKLNIRSGTINQAINNINAFIGTVKSQYDKKIAANIADYLLAYAHQVLLYLESL